MIKQRSAGFKTSNFQLGQVALDLQEIGADFPWLVEEECKRLHQLAEAGVLDAELKAEDGQKLTLMAKENVGVSVVNSLDEYLAGFKPAPNR